MSEPAAPRPRFDRQAFAVLRQAALQAMAEVPELRGVALVCLWDLPETSGVPSSSLVLPEGKPPGVDTLIRMGLEASRFQAVLNGATAEGLARLHQHASELARTVTHETQRRAAVPQATPAPGRGGGPGGPPGPAAPGDPGAGQP